MRFDNGSMYLSAYFWGGCLMALMFMLASPIVTIRAIEVLTGRTIGLSWSTYLSMGWMMLLLASSARMTHGKSGD